VDTPPAKLEVDDVSMLFPDRGGGVLALDHLSMRIEEGEFVCIIGGSGCGKSTLLNVIGGLLRPTSGRIHVAGREIKGPGADPRFSDYRRKIYDRLNH